MSTEAQKRASKKYREKNKDYYNEKNKESIKRIRQERWEYKARCEKALDYLNNAAPFRLIDLQNILEGKTWK